MLGWHRLFRPQGPSLCREAGSPMVPLLRSWGSSCPVWGLASPADLGLWSTLACLGRAPGQLFMDGALG